MISTGNKLAPTAAKKKMVIYIPLKIFKTNFFYYLRLKFMHCVINTINIPSMAWL